MRLCLLCVVLVAVILAGCANPSRYDTSVHDGNAAAPVAPYTDTVAMGDRSDEVQEPLADNDKAVETQPPILEVAPEKNPTKGRPVSPPPRETAVVAQRDFAGPLPWRSWTRTHIFGKYKPLASVFKGERRTGSGHRYYHQGVDVLAPRGTPLVAPADGEVVRAGNWDPHGYGNAVLIRVRLSRGGDVFVLYAHMDKVEVRAGQAVKRGQRVGAAGANGNARSMPKKEEHVHVEVRTSEKTGPGLSDRVDPFDYFPDIVRPQEMREGS